MLAAHFDKAVMLFSVLFLLSLCAAIWVWRGKGFDGQHGSVPYEVQPRALFAVSICTDVAYVSNGSPFRGM